MLNFPNSVLNQLIGEYGLIGFLLFIIFYLFYFLKRYKELSYGLILLPIFYFSYLLITGLKLLILLLF